MKERIKKYKKSLMIFCAIMAFMVCTQSKCADPQQAHETRFEHNAEYLIRDNIHPGGYFLDEDDFCSSPFLRL